MKNLLLAIAAVAGLAIFTSSANAQCFYRGGGFGGYGYQPAFVGRSFAPAYGYGYRSPYVGRSYYSGYGFNRGIYNGGFYTRGINVRTRGFGLYIR